MGFLIHKAYGADAVSVLMLVSSTSGRNGLQLSFTARREFFFLAPRPGCKSKDGSINRELPREFLHLEQNPKGKTLACTTLELNALNARLNDATKDCLQLTYQVGSTVIPELETGTVCPFKKDISCKRLT